MQSPSVPEQAKLLSTWFSLNWSSELDTFVCQSGADLERFCCSGFTDLSWSLPFSMLGSGYSGDRPLTYSGFPYCCATRYPGSPSVSGQQNHGYPASCTSAPDLPIGGGKIGLSSKICVTERGVQSFYQLNWPLQHMILSQMKAELVLVLLLAFP